LSSNRTRRGMLVLATAALVLSACAQGPSGPLATVDGEEIPRELLEGWMRSAVDGNPDLDPVGLQLDLLTSTIQTRIFEGILAERGLIIDPALLEAARASIVAQVGGELSLETTLADIGFPRAYFEEIFLRRQAIGDTLILDLSQGRTQETRTARHILVETAAEADEIFAELADGADFADLARDRSLDPGSGAAGGDLGPAPRGVYVASFEEAVWAAELDTVLEPVQSDFGFHVIEVTGATTLTADQLTPQARQQLVGTELTAIIQAALRAAEVTVDPTIGTWDPDDGRVLPVGATR